MTQPDPYLISISSQIETLLGYKINNIADAKKVASLFDANKLTISSHTIARIFGVVKPFRTPYKETLNLLAQFLKYKDWDDYCANQTNIPFDPNYFLTEASDGFSLAVLQLALVNEDVCSLQLVIDKATNNESQSLLFTAAALIGEYVRNSSKQKEMLQLLADTSKGRELFYECYVDEDNPNNYFTEALVQFYLPKVTDDYKRLFVYSFVISQTAHKDQIASTYIPEFKKLTAQLDKNNCHFHELSRWLECLIIIDGCNGVLKNTWKNHIDELLELIIDLSELDRAWIIARSLKALVLFDLKEEVFHHAEFNAAIALLIQNQRKESHHMALYVIQLYWIAKLTYFNNKTIYHPFRIHSTLFQNESNEKAAIEFAIAAFFASGDNKQIVERNLNSFCETKGTLWVLKLVNP